MRALPSVQVEMESVKEYVQQSSNVVSLHSQIQSCDVILARMQEMLLGFQVGRTNLNPLTYQKIFVMGLECTQGRRAAGHPFACISPMLHFPHTAIDRSTTPLACPTFAYA